MAQTSMSLTAPQSSIVNDSVVAAAEADWLNQLRDLEEVERWEKIGDHNVAHSQKIGLEKILSNFSGLDRIPILKVMSIIEWKPIQVSKIFDMFVKVTAESSLKVIRILEGFMPSKELVELVLSIFHQLRDIFVLELIDRTTVEDVHLLMQVARHLPQSEIETLHECIELLSTTDVINLLKRCNEPFAKDCELCRQKRINDLEFRKIQKQIPNGMIPVAGTIPLYATPQRWTADDEKLLTFDTALGAIYWKRERVDLIQICDECLMDVHQALTNKGRFDPIFNVDASHRKEVMLELRKKEQTLAEILWVVSKERKQRRTREFALRALTHQRAGLKREFQAAEKAETERKQQEALKLKERQRKELVNKALQKQDKWNQAEQTAMEKKLENRFLFSEVQLHTGFGVNRPAPIARQYSLTWRLKNFDEDGIAITEEGANIAFGQHIDVDHGELPLIKAWKNKADKKIQDYRDRKEKEAAEKREQELREYVKLKDYVNERTKLFRRREKQMELMSLQEEADRVERRKADKKRVKEEKFLKYLECERLSMIMEDEHSYKRRFYEWECDQIAREREDMFNAECEQTDVDRFWGLIVYERRINEEEKRLRRLYEQKVMRLNQELVVQKTTLPFKKHVNAIIINEGGSSGNGGAAVKVDREETFIEAHQRKLIENEQRLELIKKLKAEEVRGKLKYRGDYKMSMWIPKDLRGKVIGKRDVVITNLQRESKVKLNALLPVGNSSWIAVVILGGYRNIITAYNAISEIVEHEVDGVVLEFMINYKKPFFLYGGRKFSIIKRISTDTNVRIFFPEFNPKEQPFSEAVPFSLEGECIDVQRAVGELENEAVLYRQAQTQKFAARNIEYDPNAERPIRGRDIREPRESREVPRESRESRDTAPRASATPTAVTNTVQVQRLHELVNQNERVNARQSSSTAAVAASAPSTATASRTAATAHHEPSQEHRMEVEEGEGTRAARVKIKKTIEVPSTLVGLLLSKNPKAKVTILNQIQHMTHTVVSKIINRNTLTDNVEGEEGAEGTAASAAAGGDASGATGGAFSGPNSRRRSIGEEVDSDDDSESEESASGDEAVEKGAIGAKKPHLRPSKKNNVSGRPVFINSEDLFVTFRIMGYTEESVDMVISHLKRIIAGERIKLVLEDLREKAHSLSSEEGGPKYKSGSSSSSNYHDSAMSAHEPRKYGSSREVVSDSKRHHSGVSTVVSGGFLAVDGGASNAPPRREGGRDRGRGGRGADRVPQDAREQRPTREDSGVSKIINPDTLTDNVEGEEGAEGSAASATALAGGAESAPGAPSGDSTKGLSDELIQLFADVTIEKIFSKTEIPVRRSPRFKKTSTINVATTAAAYVAKSPAVGEAASTSAPTSSTNVGIAASTTSSRPPSGGIRSSLRKTKILNYNDLNEGRSPMTDHKETDSRTGTPLSMPKVPQEDKIIPDCLSWPTQTPVSSFTLEELMDPSLGSIDPASADSTAVQKLVAHFRLGQIYKQASAQDVLMKVCPYVKKVSRVEIQQMLAVYNNEPVGRSVKKIPQKCGKPEHRKKIRLVNPRDMSKSSVFSLTGIDQIEVYEVDLKEKELEKAVCEFLMASRDVDEAVERDTSLASVQFLYQYLFQPAKDVHQTQRIVRQSLRMAVGHLLEDMRRDVEVEPYPNDATLISQLYYKGDLTELRGKPDLLLGKSVKCLLECLTLKNKPEHTEEETRKLSYKLRELTTLGISVTEVKGVGALNRATVGQAGCYLVSLRQEFGCTTMCLLSDGIYYSLMVLSSETNRIMYTRVSPSDKLNILLQIIATALSAMEVEKLFLDPNIWKTAVKVEVTESDVTSPKPGRSPKPGGTRTPPPDPSSGSSDSQPRTDNSSSGSGGGNNSINNSTSNSSSSSGSGLESGSTGTKTTKSTLATAESNISLLFPDEISGEADTSWEGDTTTISREYDVRRGASPFISIAQFEFGEYVERLRNDKTVVGEEDPDLSFIYGS